MKTKYEYAEFSNCFDIIKTVTDENTGNQTTTFVAEVDEKRSAELIVSELNTIYRSVHKTVSNAKLKVQAQE